MHIETRKSRCAGNRRRIMDSGLHSALLQVSLQITSVAPLNTNHIKVMDAIDSVRHEWGDNAGNGGEQFVIGLGVPSPHFIASIEIRQFPMQYCCLKAIQAAVVTNGMMFIFLESAVIAQPSHCRCDVVIVGYDGAGVSACTKVLRRIKAKAGGVAKGACSSAMVTGAMGLGCVLDYFQAISFGYREDCIHIGRLPVQVDRYDGSSLLRDMTLDLTGIDVVSLGMDVHKNRLSARMDYCFSGSHKAVRRRYDLIVAADSQRPECKYQRIGSVGDTNRVFDLAEFGKRSFKLIDLRSSYKGGAVQQTIPNLSKLAAKPLMLADEIHEWNC